MWLRRPPARRRRRAPAMTGRVTRPVGNATGVESDARNSSSAWRSSTADGYRFAGSFSRQRMTMASRRDGMPGHTCESGAGRSRSTAAMTDIGELPWKGRRPDSSSYRTAPKANTSARASTELAVRLLRRHVGRRPHRQRRRRSPAFRSCVGANVSEAGDRISFARPKSSTFTWPLRFTRMFAGLHVAMDDAGLVRRGERTGGLDGVLERQRHWHRRLADQRIERAAVHELHRDERHLAGGVDVVDVDDVRVVERGGGLRFLDEAALAVGVRARGGRQDLDGDGAVQARVDGAIDGAHAAFADLGDDRVVRKLLALHDEGIIGPRAFQTRGRSAGRPN